MRNQIVDIARGIGILLVVFGHNGIVLDSPGELYEVIYSFHIPLFFFLSGIFLNPSQSFKKVFLSRADSLLKPYFVIMSCVGIAVVIFRNKSPLQYLFLMLWGSLSSIIEATGTYFGSYVWCVLWFLPHLFATYIVSWFIACKTKHFSRFKKGLVAGLLLVLGLVCIGSINNNFISSFLPSLALPFSGNIIFISSSFLLSGHYLSTSACKFKISIPLFISTTLGFLYLHYLFDANIDFAKYIYSNPIISSLEAFLGIYVVFHLSASIEKLPKIGSWLSVIGSKSLFILLFHWLFQALTLRILAKANQDFYYLNNIIAFVMAISLSLATLSFVERSKLMAILLLPYKFNKHCSRDTKSSNC